MAKEHPSVKKMWNEFIQTHGIDPEIRHTSWPFGGDKVSVKELLELVIRGQKRATASLYDIYEYIDEPLPKAGDYSVVTDWEGIARCVIKTTRVEITPFNLISQEFARKEGEGDLSLEYWREVHREFFSRDLRETLGKEFKEDMLVVCEEFELVFS